MSASGKPARVYYLSGSEGGPAICILREHHDGEWELREAVAMHAADGKRFFRVGGGGGGRRSWVGTLLRYLAKLRAPEGPPGLPWPAAVAEAPTATPIKCIRAGCTRPAAPGSYYCAADAPPVDN